MFLNLLLLLLMAAIFSLANALQLYNELHPEAKEDDLIYAKPDEDLRIRCDHESDEVVEIFGTNPTSYKSSLESKLGRNYTILVVQDINSKDHEVPFADFTCRTGNESVTHTAYQAKTFVSTPKVNKAYVGDIIVVSCSLYMKHSYKIEFGNSTVHFDCPRCDKFTAIVRENFIGREKRFSLTIPNAVESDTSNYSCTPVVNGVLLAGQKKSTRVVVEEKESTKRAIAEEGRNWALLLLSVTGISFLVASVLFLFIIYKQRQNLKRMRRKMKEELNPKNAVPPTEQDPTQPIEDRIAMTGYNAEAFEIDCERLEFVKELGSGNFGTVKLANLMRAHKGRGQYLRVAVKMVKPGSNHKREEAELKMLVHELKLMTSIGRHPCLLAAIGGVTSKIDDGQIYIVLELCETDLKKYLKLRKDTFLNEIVKGVDENGYFSGRKVYCAELNSQWPTEKSEKRRTEPLLLTTSDLLAFSLQIAQGMKHLSEIPCIHRDLAARNVLVSSDGICKIADFGLARRENIYWDFKNGALPIKWMSPEAIDVQEFTPESDVWSYGIVLYEIFSLGEQPYQRFRLSNCSQFSIYLREGNRNPPPPNAHPDVCDYMKECWNVHPRERPSFDDAIKLFSEHLKRANLEEFATLTKKLEVEAQNDLSSWVQTDNIVCGKDEMGYLLPAVFV